MNLDKQVERLLALDYPARMGLSAEAFAELVRSAGSIGERDVLVIPPTLIDPESLVPTLTLVGSDKPGVLDRNHGPQGLGDYRPIPGVEVPSRPYLLFDVDSGSEFRSVRPEDALAEIAARGRTPLTISEGIALHTHYPELLRKNECYMLGGSSRGDRRVPGLWISHGAPKLGWCWLGNPHSWLGMASAVGRGMDFDK